MAWARSEAGGPCLAHPARISSFHGMSGLIKCWYSPVPHVATMSANNSSVSNPSLRAGIRVTLEHDKRGCARGISRREQRRRRERTDVRDEDRFGDCPRWSSTAVMLSADCSKVGAPPA